MTSSVVLTPTVVPDGSAGGLPSTSAQQGVPSLGDIASIPSPSDAHKRFSASGDRWYAVAANTSGEHWFMPSPAASGEKWRLSQSGEKWQQSQSGEKWRSTPETSSLSLRAPSSAAADARDEVGRSPGPSPGGAKGTPLHGIGIMLNEGDEDEDEVSVGQVPSIQKQSSQSRRTLGNDAESTSEKPDSKPASDAGSDRSELSGVAAARRRATLVGKNIQNKDLRKSFAPGQDNDDYSLKEAIIDMQREALRSTLTEAVTIFWKREGNPDWESNPKEIFLNRLQDIRKFKNETLCLRAEVDNYILRHKILHVKAKEYEESNEERHFRRLAFWVEWRDQHDYARKLDVPVVWHPGTSSQNEQMSQKRGVPTIGKVFQSNRRASTKQVHEMLTSKGFSTKLNIQAFGQPTARDKKKVELRSQVMRSTKSEALLPSIKAPPQMAKYRQQRPKLNSSPQLPPIAEDAQRMSRVGRASRRASTRPDIQNLTPDIAGAEGSSTRAYFRECDFTGIMPRLMPMVTGHSGALVAKDRAFSDLDLQALSMMVSSMENVEEVNLHGNSGLSDAGLSNLVRNLFGKHVTISFESLNLGRCVGAGRGTLAGITMLLTDRDGARNLKHLNLSSIKLPTIGSMPICEAIGRHSHLLSVNFADTGLGEKLNAADCVEAIVSCRSLDELDLSWNSFGTEVFLSLGESLGGDTKLRKLSLANTNSMKSVIGTLADKPLTFFLELLKDNKSLTRLDIAMNGLNFRGSLIIEDALENHPKIREMDVSENPLGNLGMRSLVRLLSRDSTSLLYFGSENCNDGVANEGTEDGAQLFNPCNPNGRYNLKLARPYHRAILRMLLKCCERLSLQPDQAMVDVSYSLPPWEQPYQAGGLWQVPTQGNLHLTFTTERAEEGALKGVGEHNFGDFLTLHYRLLKLTPGFKKIVPLFAWWKMISDRTKDLLVLLSALAKDFIISYPQMEQLCQTRFIKADAIYQLLHCVDGGVIGRYLTLLLTPSLREYLSNRTRMKSFLLLSIENPSGHYRLDLENCSDHAVAERLFLLDRWECGQSEKKGRVNVSQTRFRSQVRNGLWQDIPLPSNIADFHLPESGTLEFDYSSCKRPPEDAKPLDGETFAFFMTILQDASTNVLPPQDVIDVLRTLSENFYLNSRQQREILGLFKQPQDRAELFVVFFLRVTDIVNEKIFRVRFEDAQELWELRQRLGHVMCFPFIQPEGQQYYFELKQYDSRLCLNLLININAKEKISNISKFEFVDENGVVDPLPLGIPNSWKFFDRMPKRGTFKCTYVCAPEDRNFKFRAELLQTYGYWTLKNVTADDVMWWSGLKEAPMDVIDYLEFLVSRYSNIYKPFYIIDGEDGNGEITLREFEDGIKAMDCRKFDGPDKQKRLESVFRYLDPGNEGTVSLDEWGLLENLWKEMRLSISEFVHFLQRRFGNPEEDRGLEFLDRAWDFLDEDGSGEITEDEWNEALEQELKYFGNARTIFAFLDKDEEGDVSPDEFVALKVFLHYEDTESARTGMTMSTVPTARTTEMTTERSKSTSLNA
mmetsp:Transcript_27065/g.62578  ORF Transcript_27065/g.62578 Transcript_27065/m.62578 type:complete len:1540 (+) Transcript_27065:138-4757(+)